jgi:ATP-dependent DNA ligase
LVWAGARVRADRSSPSYEPCLPRPAKEPPAGPGWFHEIKHDGFRILAHRRGRAIHSDRKRRLAGLLRLPHHGIALNETYREDCAIIFKHACALGREGIVSKRLGLPYRAGRSPLAQDQEPGRAGGAAGGRGRLELIHNGYQRPGRC